MPLPRREEENKEKENKKSLGIQKTTFCNDKATQWTITIYWVLVWLIFPLRLLPVQIDHPRISGVFISGNCYWLEREWVKCMKIENVIFFSECGRLKNWFCVCLSDLICWFWSRFVSKCWREWSEVLINQSWQTAKPSKREKSETRAFAELFLKQTMSRWDCTREKS